MPCRKAGKHELFRYTLLTRKGKTCKSVRRKATGLNPEKGMAAGRKEVFSCDGNLKQQDYQPVFLVLPFGASHFLWFSASFSYPPKRETRTVPFIKTR